MSFKIKSDINIRRELEAEISHLTHLIENHAESKRYQSSNNHNSFMSSRPGSTILSNSQYKTHKNAYKFTKKNHITPSKSQNSMKSHQIITSLKTINSANSLLMPKFNKSASKLTSKQVTKKVSTYEENRRVFLKNHSKRTVIGKSSVSKQSTLDKSCSSQTLCKEIIDVTEKLKQKQKSMQKVDSLKHEIRKGCNTNYKPSCSYKIDNRQKLLPELNSAPIANQTIGISATCNKEAEEKHAMLVKLKQTILKPNVCEVITTTSNCKNFKEVDIISKDDTYNSRIAEAKILNPVDRDTKSLNLVNVFRCQKQKAKRLPDPKATKSDLSCSNNYLELNVTNGENPDNVRGACKLTDKVFLNESMSFSDGVEIKLNSTNALTFNYAKKKLSVTNSSKSINSKYRTSNKGIKNRKKCISGLKSSEGKKGNANKISKYKVVNTASDNASLAALKQSNKFQVENIQERQKGLNNEWSKTLLNSKYKLVNRKVLRQTTVQKQVNKTTDSKIYSLKKDKEMLYPNFKVTKKFSPNFQKKITHCLQTTPHLPILKKTQQKSLKSKYKLLNEFTPVKSSCVKSTKYDKPKSHSKKISSGKSKRLLNSRFAIVNKKMSPITKPWESPFNIADASLTKRIYKSTRTIINKNVSPIHQVARMIKTKYRIVNKNKTHLFKPHCSHISPKKFHMTNFSGHSKRYKNYPNPSYAFSQNSWKQQFPTKRKRCYLKNNSKKTKLLHIGGISYNASKTKMSRKTTKFNNNKCMRSPVLVIRGVRFAIDPSGKTLKRLPYGGIKDTESPRKVVIGGKTFVRVAADVLKETNTFSKTLASRALTRSINRVLASTKKNVKKINKYCTFYNRFGRCNDGIKCSYIHDPSKIAVCTRFLRGTCKIDGCLFSHEVSPGKMALCSFFLLGCCTKKNCPYRHEVIKPGTKLCTNFVQGYCSDGKECKNVHILVCPHYVQGKCEKGSLCAYPHPPQRKRKLEADNKSEILASTHEENMDEKKETDENELLDEVSRYFLFPFKKETTMATADLSESTPDTCGKNEDSNIVVPWKCQLPVQPSYIPLSMVDNESK